MPARTVVYGGVPCLVSGLRDGGGDGCGGV